MGVEEMQSQGYGSCGENQFNSAKSAGNQTKWIPCPQRLIWGEVSDALMPQPLRQRPGAPAPREHSSPRGQCRLAGTRLGGEVPREDLHYKGMTAWPSVTSAGRRGRPGATYVVCSNL